MECQSWAARLDRLLALIEEVKRRPAQLPEHIYQKLGCGRSLFFEYRNFLRDQVGFEFEYDRRLGRYVVGRDPYQPGRGLSPRETYALLICAAEDTLALRAARKLIRRQG